MISRSRIFVPVFLVTALAVGAAMPGGPAGLRSSDLPKDLLRQHLISFLQSGNRLASIPSTHAIYPLRSIPLVATASYLLMNHDPSLLEGFYPDLKKLVLRPFDRNLVTEEGLVPGSIAGKERGSIRLSPALNAFANLELYSLHLIAASIGEYGDAIELLQWSNNYADVMTTTFYSARDGFFMPIDRDGFFSVRYEPEQLLPLLLDRKLGDRNRMRMLENFAYKRRIYMKSQSGGQAGCSLVNDPLMRPVILDLLDNIPGFSPGILGDAMPGTATVQGDIPESSMLRHWIEFWEDHPPSTRDLFPGWARISTVKHLILILEQESLLEEKELKELSRALDSVLDALPATETDINMHVATTSEVNILLAKISRFSTFITSGSKLWKAVNENRWRRISPRIKRLITESCQPSLDELMRVKAHFSGTFEKSSGIVADVRLPLDPIPIGRRADFDATLRSVRDSFTVYNVYLQIGDNRWKVTKDNDRVDLVPGKKPFTFTKALPLSAVSRQGVVTIPLYFDFMHDGKRIELHHIESVVLTKGYEVTMTFPEGRWLKDRPLPVQIILKYRPDHDIQGTVNGSLIEGLSVSPELPARFLLRADRDLTTLPIEITPGRICPPGRYPLSLWIEVDGKTIARFRENLLKPLRWFYLGPVSNMDWIMKNAIAYQDDLFKVHRSPDGHVLQWRELPPNAIRGDGSIDPKQLFGMLKNHCMLLYTIIESPARMKIRWKLDTGNATTLWVNSSPVVSNTEVRERVLAGVLDLRRGLNSFLLASSWEVPDGVLFEFSDESGLPVSGISNDVERIVEGFERIARQKPEVQPEERSADRLHEVLLRLVYPGATEVHVIGSFNSWQAGATAMERAGPGAWTVRILLPPGRYPYRFLIDRTTRIEDPNAAQSEPDGFGGTNSVLVVK